MWRAFMGPDAALIKALSQHCFADFALLNWLRPSSNSRRVFLNLDVTLAQPLLCR